MTSYSKVFKAPYVSVTDEVKVIVHPVAAPVGMPTDPEQVEEAEFQMHRQHLEQMIKETEERAAQIVHNAEMRARSLEQAAEQKIDDWWTENRQKLDELAADAQRKGYEEGYHQGSQDGYLHAQNEYEGKIEQARSVLTQAYAEKTSIVGEAEPFLLELSTAIAEQILKQELTSYPEKFLALIQQHILRFKERDAITICVNPADFPFIQEQRNHLLSMVQGETEIKVIPDHSVTPQGCVIRTAFGSVDARLDTQLDEIKKVILEAGKGLEHAVSG